MSHQVEKCLPLVLWLGDERCHTVAAVGGKAASLSRLAGRYRVPPGFCLTTAAFDLAHTAGMLTAGGVTDSSDSLLPPEVHAALAAAYARLALLSGDEEPPVAVRSSALDEDGATVSFAGQHETYLNIAGISDLTGAVIRCWRSLSTPRAAAYRHRHGLSIEQTRLAVLVQQLVPADASAIAFSANPVTGGRDEAIVTASWGLGESLVGGVVTPDTYIVRKHDGAIVMVALGDKRVMTVLARHGTAQVEVAEPLRERPALDDEQVRDVAHLCTALEAEMGMPVDIECAWRAGRLYLLQCRPITAMRSP